NHHPLPDPAAGRTVRARRVHLERRHANGLACLWNAGIRACGDRRCPDWPPAWASRAHERRERLAGRGCPVDLRDGLLAAGGDPQPQPSGESRGGLARRRPVGVAREDHRRRRQGRGGGGPFLRRAPYARPLPVGVLSPAAVRLVKLRELDGGGGAERHGARHRYLAEAARRLRAAAARSGGQGGDRGVCGAQNAPVERERMSSWIANARMYAVTPEVESAWRGLLERVATEADVALDYLPFPAPQPLEQLWSRSDLGSVLMCGYPIALQLADVQPIAAPIPRVQWAAGRAVYRTDLIVREDAPFARLEDTFGGRAGWTVAHSHSGFNAFRHHLLAYRRPQRPKLYREMIGNLVTARNVLDAVREGRIDVGPLDAYWHMLIARHAPRLCE